MLHNDLKGPFLPFTGKGSARRRLRAVEIEEAEALSRMRSLVACFREAFRAPPAYLALHHRYGAAAVRWRARGREGNQPYFELCASDRGERILTQLPPAARERYLHFDRQRIDLNYAASLVQYEARKLRDYLAHVEAVNATRRAHGFS